MILWRTDDNCAKISLNLAFCKVFMCTEVALLWCCHNETQTRNAARNNFFIVVLGVQMCMHYMKFVGVYHIDPSTVRLSYFIKNKTQNMFFHLGFELGIAWSRLFSVTICATDLTDV